MIQKGTKRNIMNIWKTYKLSEVTQMIGGGTPKTTVEEYWNGDIPWLSVVDFGRSGKTVYKTEKTITEKGLKESSTKILKKGQLIISARGTVGELAMLGRDMAFNQSCYGLTATKETTNEFLYYLVKDSVGKIKQNTHGAVFDTITKQTFENIEVTIPECLETQTQIAQILASLDDKIELNLQMNQTLEAMAQALFKEWFVNFNFPNFDGELENDLPKGWRMGSLSEIMYVQNGFAFKSNDFIDEGENGILKIKNISNKVVDIVNMQCIPSEVAMNIDKRFKVESGDLLIAMTGAEVGKVGMVPNTEKNLWLNQRVGSFKEKVKYSKWFCYLILSTNEYQNILLSTASGSANRILAEVKLNVQKSFYLQWI